MSPRRAASRSADDGEHAGHRLAEPVEGARVVAEPDRKVVALGGGTVNEIVSSVRSFSCSIAKVPTRIAPAAPTPRIGSPSLAEQQAKKWAAIEQVHLAGADRRDGARHLLAGQMVVGSPNSTGACSPTPKAP